MIQLVGGRLVQGLGSGVMNTAIFVCVAQAFDARQRPRMFTYISTAWVLPSFVGPPISAWLTQHLSWHWVFFAVLPLVAVRRRDGAADRSGHDDAAHVRAEAVAGGARPAPLWAAGLVALAAAALQVAGQRLDWVALGLAVGGRRGAAGSACRG